MDNPKRPAIVLLTVASLQLVAMVALPSARAGDDRTSSQPATTQASGKGAESDKPLQGDVEKASVTDQRVTIDGNEWRFRATAANMPMKDEQGKLRATVFFVAYEAYAPEKEDEKPRLLATEPGNRPITFVFNGGPGAAAVWLHLGTAGPRRIDLHENGEVPPPPFRLVDNAWSWLDATDLVFIDPVGTGFSRPVEGEKREEFFGVREDIRWVADFIRLYLTRYERWASPLFLAGESYGTTRAAGLSEYLLNRYGIALNGIVFISTVLDFQTLSPGNANDLPYVLYLPTYAAIAWYHNRLSAELRQDFDRTLREVERWAMTDYTIALAKGSELRGDVRRAVLEKLARYTSLPAEFIERNEMRISPAAFQKQLLAADRKLVGRFDARITGDDPEPASNWPAYDPSLSQYKAIYSSCFNDYVRRVLKYESVLPYEVLTDRVRPWKYGEEGTGYLSVADDLRSAMVKNPHLKLLFASGHFDLATPYWATQYTIDHLKLAESGRSNIRHEYFAGGHMMYHNHEALRKLKTDIAEFVRWATGQPGR